MGGIALALVVGLVAILIGAGVGYAFAAGRYSADLCAATQKQQELQRQIASAPPQASSEASAARLQHPAEVVSPSAPEPAPATPRVPALTHAPWEAAREAITENSSVAADGSEAEADGGGMSPAGIVSGADPRSTLTSFVAIAHQAGALMMLDIDHLRKFRERYGPQLGDYVSNHVERVIRDSLQETSAVISRYEDQEFLIALPEIPGDASERLMAARRAASEVRAEVQRAFLQVGSERLTVTASIGLAMMETGVPSEEIIARADEALHAAKRAGRNCAYYQSAGDCLPVEPLTESGDGSATQHSAATKQASDNSGSKRSSCRDRRRHERMPCYSVNLIAPCRDDVVPAIDKFERVQFLDLSVSGFSMILPAVPTTDVFCVALFNHRGMIFMSAEVANVRQAPRAGHGKPLVIVGCRFKQRLYPDRPMPNLFSENRQHDAAISAILQSL